MSYYILPKINNSIFFSPSIELKDIKPIVSYTYVKYLNDVKNQLNKLCNENNCLIDNIIKMINPYEYIFSKVPNSKYSVSKLKMEDIIFYNLLEINNLLNLFTFYESQNINSLHIGYSNNSSIDFLNILREENNDNNLCFNDFQEINSYKEIQDSLETHKTAVLKENGFDYLFYNTIIHNNDINEYTINMLEIIQNILTYQKSNGIAIIKILDIINKPIIDILYMLCNFYEKVYIIKPNTVNILSNTKFIVCKKFISNNYNYDNFINYKSEIQKIINFYYSIKRFNTKLNDNVVLSSNLDNTFFNGKINLTTLIKNEYQYFFINKLEEFNIITGQQQIEAYDQIINIFKNKNRDEKLENLKKNNIQKCIQWCEKYKIPCNKFTEMFNIFLPSTTNNNTNTNKNEENYFIYNNFDNNINNNNNNISNIDVDVINKLDSENENKNDIDMDMDIDISLKDNNYIDPVMCIEEDIINSNSIIDDNNISDECNL